MTTPTTLASLEIDRILSDAKSLKKRLTEAEERIREREAKVDLTVKSMEALGGLEGEEFRKFFRKPYAVLPYKGNEFLVVVPKFVDFQVGWLHQQTETYNIFRFSQYAAWLGEAPQELLDLVGAKRDITGTVAGDTLTFPPGELPQVKAILGKHLEKFGEGEAKVRKGHEFDLIVDMVKHGCLPFQPRPVAAEDKKPIESKFDLYPYQQRAFDRFMETGAIGIFHPTGAGKSFIAMKCADALRGRKLVVVPTTTLKEQWDAYIKENLRGPSGQWDQFTIVTYQTHSQEVLGRHYVLAIFDEAQVIPANTFSRFALVDAKYRIGLSAAPFREDGREAYIFALTGYPVGLDWKEYIRETGQTYHPITVYLVKSDDDKMQVLRKILNPKKKTLIFSDTIELGQRIAATFDIPFIYSDTTNRMDIISQNRVVAASRVADLGVSIKDLEHIIEVDFLFGSRSQELQRTGRLMHSRMKEARHDVIMTELELERYGKRLWSLQEKGFTVEIRPVEIRAEKPRQAGAMAQTGARG